MEQKERILHKVQKRASKLTKVLLIRHGEVENVQDGVLRYNGHIDVELSERGRAQMEDLALFIERNGDVLGIPEVVYSSDLKRSRESADILSRRLKSKRKVMKDLREVAQGIWEGLTVEEVLKKYPEMAKKRFENLAEFRVPGGESIKDAESRVIPAFWKIVSDNEGKVVAIVGHAAINSIILAKVLDIPYTSIMKLRFDFGSLSILDIGNGYSVVRLLNASTYSRTVKP